MEATEMRQYPRITPPRNVYAVFGMNKDVIGRLCDISMGGASCKYFTDSENGNECSSLDLFAVDNECCISRIPCSVVYSVLDEESWMGSAMAVKSRRVGIKFDNLDYLQQSQLKSFVENIAKSN